MFRLEITDIDFRRSQKEQGDVPYYHMLRLRAHVHVVRRAYRDLRRSGLSPFVSRMTISNLLAAGQDQYPYHYLRAVKGIDV